VDLLNRFNPAPFVERMISTTRTLNYSKILSDQLVWAKAIFLHVCLTISAVFGKVPAAYYAPAITADSASHEIDALMASGTARAP